MLLPALPSAATTVRPFRVSVINDEISQDFGHVCEVASRDFGMGWIELRSMWKKNIVSLDEKEVAEARRILDKFQLKVTDIASPLFKVDWPGAPKSKYSEAKSFNASFDLSQQDEVFDRAIAMAKIIWNRPGSLLRFLASGGSGALIARPSMTNCGRPPPRQRKMESFSFSKTSPPATPPLAPNPRRF